ncbi:MAG: response regulator [Candidatus Lokiarchaeota archaeon]|nr:response regulator [Candidatus Lokiarchaeota archaeon]
MVSSAQSHLGKILVIDDELAIRKTVGSMLQKQNYLVETAEDYNAIKDKLFVSNYDALILDIVLPDVDGISILHEINKANLNLPTIMLTGAPSLETAKMSVKYGAFDYLIKPVKKEVLLNDVRNAIQKKRLIDTKKALLEELHQKNEELELLVEQRTQELKLSEIRHRTVIESVNDLIVITDAEGQIKFSNDIFMDEVSKVFNRDIPFKEVKDKFIGSFFTITAQMTLDEVFQRIMEGGELDALPITLNHPRTMQSPFLLQALIRGIFNEDLILQEIIFIISRKH